MFCLHMCVQNKRVGLEVGAGLILVWQFTSTKLSSFAVDISKPFLAASLFRSWHSRTATLFFSSSVSSWRQNRTKETSHSVNKHNSSLCTSYTTHQPAYTELLVLCVDLFTTFTRCSGGLIKSAVLSTVPGREDVTLHHNNKNKVLMQLLGAWKPTRLHEMVTVSN